MNRLQKANEYIQNNKHKTTNRPLFHFSPEIGWINDPNGFTFYKGKYHLFYQYYPYDTIWNDMHWGHATTSDFMNWDHLPVAMANDKVYDANGCFSGSAIEKDGKLYLMYTGHIDPNLGFEKDDSQIVQRQCIAFSDDGVNFEKSQLNPVIGEKELPEGYLICDFRDPKVFKEGDTYYCVIAVRNEKRRGEIIMFQSKDLLEWTFHSSIYQTKFEENTLLECPDFFQVDGKDIMIFSEMPCDPEFENEVEKKTSYVIGKMDFVEGHFQPEVKGLLDYSTFYAPQTTEGENGERLLIGWMHRWGKLAPPKEYGYNGMMSLPRKLSIKNQQLVQEAFVDHDRFFKTVFHEENLSLEKLFEFNHNGAGYFKMNISDQSEKFTIEFNKSETKSTRVTVDTVANSLKIESDYGSNTTDVIPSCFEGTEKILEFYLDLHSIELFINSGEKVVTFTAYDEDKGNKVMISGENTELNQIHYAKFE
jgi:beta-fructofuranosidase